jgi:hypothetical protein
MMLTVFFHIFTATAMDMVYSDEHARGVSEEGVVT